MDPEKTDLSKKEAARHVAEAGAAARAEASATGGDPEVNRAIATGKGLSFGSLLALEEINSPFVTGGKVTVFDMAIALLCADDYRRVFSTDRDTLKAAALAAYGDMNPMELAARVAAVAEGVKALNGEGDDSQGKRRPARAGK